MAYNSQGIALRLVADVGTYYTSELINVSVDGIKADTVEVTGKYLTGRTKSFRAGDRDLGTISATFRDQATGLLTAALVGVYATLTISSPGGTLYDGPCVIESLAWSGSVGALQEYRATFKLGALT